MAELENETVVEEGGEGPSGLPFALEIHIVIGVQCIVGIVGLFGNILALYHYIRRGERRTHIVGVLTLVVKDLLNCSIALPRYIVLEAKLFRMSNDFLCKMSHLVGNTNLTATLLLLMILAIERCACISHNPRHSMRWKTAVAVVIAVLVVALGLGVVPALAAGIWGKVPINQGNRNSTNSTLELTSTVKNQRSQLQKLNRCVMNEQIISMEAIRKYYSFFRFLDIFSAVVSLVAYVIAFVVVVYRRHLPTPSTVLFQKQENTGIENQEREDNSDNVAADIANSQCTELEEEKKTQRTFGLMFFAVTGVFWVSFLPGMLILHGHIRGRLAFFMMHQIPYGVNPLVYLAIDKNFRQEVKGLFQSTWSKLRQ